MTTTARERAEKLCTEVLEWLAVTKPSTSPDDWPALTDKICNHIQAAERAMAERAARVAEADTTHVLRLQVGIDPMESMNAVLEVQAGNIADAIRELPDAE